MGGKGSGRRPKPVEQKIRLGNLGKRKLPKASIVALPVSEIPEPHRQLSPYGERLWNACWTGGSAWLKPSVDAEIVLMACELLDERVSLRARVFKNPEAWRERRGLRELDRQISQLLGQIGFSPTDRANLGVGEIKNSEFADLHKRIAQKRASSNG
jgi:hypothetical protein